MKFLTFMFALFVVFTTPVLSDEVSFSEFQVYESDPTRFSPNDRIPTLYAIKLAGKENALWVEGDDYNYQWLTIIPYDGIEGITLNRTRGNPYVTDSGSWIGKQLAKAGDIHGWFTISFVGRKDKKREIVLVAPVGGDQELAEFLERKSKTGIERFGSKGTKVESEDPVEGPLVAPPSVLLPHPKTVSPPAVTTLGRSSAKPSQAVVKLVDLMTVSDFRAAGLGKLTDGELAELDAWINRFLSTRQN